MAHKIPTILEWITSIHTLNPGDVVATGTNHRGLSPVMHGDKIELETEGLGRLHINVIDDLKSEIKKTKIFNNFLVKNNLKNSLLIMDKESKPKIY